MNGSGKKKSKKKKKERCGFWLLFRNDMKKQVSVSLLCACLLRKSWLKTKRLRSVHRDDYNSHPHLLDWLYSHAATFPVKNLIATEHFINIISCLTKTHTKKGKLCFQVRLKSNFGPLVVKKKNLSCPCIMLQIHILNILLNIFIRKHANYKSLHTEFAPLSQIIQ